MAGQIKRDMPLWLEIYENRLRLEGITNELLTTVGSGDDNSANRLLRARHGHFLQNFKTIIPLFGGCAGMPRHKVFIRLFLRDVLSVFIGRRKNHAQLPTPS